MAEKVALLEDINVAAFEIIENAGFEVVKFAKNPDEMLQAAKGAVMLGIRSGPKVSKELMEANPQLEAIGVFSVGVNVDEDYATETGRAVMNAPHENTRSVAEYDIEVAGSLMRGIQGHNMQMHSGVWSKTEAGSHELQSKTIGSIGYGTIGLQVSEPARGLGMNFIYYDEMSKNPPLTGVQKMPTVEALYEKADIITIHVPGIPETENLINDAAIAAMKPGVYIINTSRGNVVDTMALKRGLDSGKVAGAALDVFVDEPAKKGDPFEHPLQGYLNVILTPHIAGSTEEAQDKAGNSVAKKMVQYWQTGNPFEAINLPSTPYKDPTPGVPRLIYVHSNQPGALAGVEDILREANCNIGPTASDTLRDIGFAYFDIDSNNLAPAVIKAIRKLDTARRVRVIQ